MFVLGHMGIGSKIVSPWTQGLPRRALLLGTVLPDLIDKPLYYALSFATGRHGAELGLISGTRTFGHTAILLVLLAGAAAARRSQWLAALAWGVATHLLLDSLFDRFSTPDGSYVTHGLLWPLFGTSFVVIPFSSAGEHLAKLAQPLFLWTEIVGLGILSWDYWKQNHQTEILDSFQTYRMQLRRLKRRVARLRLRRQNL